MLWDPFKVQDAFSTNRSLKLHKHLPAFEKFNPCLRSTNSPQILGNLTRIRDLAISLWLLLTFPHFGIATSAIAGILTVSVLPSVCLSSNMLQAVVFSLVRAELDISRTDKLREAVPRRIEVAKRELLLLFKPQVIQNEYS